VSYALSASYREALVACAFVRARGRQPAARMSELHFADAAGDVMLMAIADA